MSDQTYTHETLRTLAKGALFVEAHGLDADLLGRVHTKMLAHADAWQEQVRLIANAIAAKAKYDEDGESGPWEAAWDALRGLRHEEGVK